MIQHLMDVPNPFWDQWFMNLIDGMKLQLGSGDFVSIAKQLAAVLSLIYLSVKAYAMIVGEGRLEIMPLFRPFLITLVIVNFSYYANIVGGVGNAATAAEQVTFQGNAEKMDGLLFTKDSLYSEFWTRVLDSSSSIQTQMTGQLNQVSDNIIDATSTMGTGWISKQFAHASNSITSYVTLYEQLMWAKLSMWIQHLIEMIVLAIFKGVAYCMFFIQMLLLHILLILGPISFAMSIVKPFKDSWVQWTQKYFAVSFYVAIALIVLNMGILIISYGIMQENSRITQILQQSITENFLKSIMHPDNFIGYLFTALIVVVGGILQVPKVCSWILGVGGEAAEGMHNHAVSTARKVGSAGASAGGAAAKAAIGAFT